MVSNLLIAVIGTGYVGLVSGACFANLGHDVICVDIDRERIADLNNGKVPIFEPGLEDLVDEGRRQSKLQFTADLKLAVGKADVVIIAVGTPSREADGRADLSFVHAAATAIGKYMKSSAVIVTKSTVPVGTGDEVERILREARPAARFEVVSNPEFLREGSAIEDFQQPDRIVVGVQSERARSAMAELYAPLVDRGTPLIVTGRRTAELTKYAANAFLAMKVTFINEIADLCERADADVEELAEGIGLDSRIGPKFLQAGPGFGGSCFPKDALALVKVGQDFGSPLRLVEATLSINGARKRAMGRKIIAAAGGEVHGKRIGVLGLTFKANTDDMRDAPSIPIIETLVEAGAKVSAYDPEAPKAAKALLPAVRFARNAYDAAADADVLVVITDWAEFRRLDFEALRDVMRTPQIVDLRNLYDGDDMRQYGFRYEGAGKSSASELYAPSQARISIPEQAGKRKARTTP